VKLHLSVLQVKLELLEGDKCCKLQIKEYVGGYRRQSLVVEFEC
jgi:hypothetical protein